MDEILTLSPYDITGKSEVQVCCKVYDRLLTLIELEAPASPEGVFDIAGPDTLFDIVAEAYGQFATNGAEAASTYISKGVHELFLRQAETSET